MKSWRCPKCDWHVETIDHPSVTVAHRCKPAIPRSQPLQPDPTTQQEKKQ